jgi:isopenicillin N synthase-like dioxygenase
MTHNQDDFKAIPLFSLDQFDPIRNDNEQFVQELREACHHVGFFYIKNHGMPLSLMKQMLMLTDAFFNLPQEEKDAINISLSPHFRGYGKLNAELTLGIPDFKESYDLGLERSPSKLTAQQPHLIMHGPNQWPKSVTLAGLNFKDTILQYIHGMQKIGEKLMMAMSLALGQPYDYFSKQFCSTPDDEFAMLRLLRYPPAKSSNLSQAREDEQTLPLGVGPHVDIGCLVLLLQDHIGGLQVQNAKGEWIDAPQIGRAHV